MDSHKTSVNLQGGTLARKRPRKLEIRSKSRHKTTSLEVSEKAKAVVIHPRDSTPASASKDSTESTLKYEAAGSNSSVDPDSERTPVGSILEKNRAHAHAQAKLSLGNDAYQVGWICALSIELSAARLLLDEIHEPPRNLDNSDNNTYHLGRIQGHNVVIACLPDSSYGMTSAAVVAESLLRSFKQIRFGLMVGIGGAIPDHKDIRLGDVVVSTPYDGSGGVIQFDFGKRVAGGKFEKTGHLDQPPRPLLNAISTIKSNHDIFVSGIPQIMRKVSKSASQQAAARYCVSPGVERDRLFQVHYEHEGSTSSCDTCDLSKTVDRPRRASDSPFVHYGLIVSGNTVMKHALSRAQLANELENALCIEMEAAGLMNHFKCIVIRGICDYCDSHKNKDWQRYAAMTAAAFAKELLSVVRPGNVQLEEPIQQVTGTCYLANFQSIHTSILQSVVISQPAPHHTRD